jgi:putative tryptophan/tyrosine transport system substrate-binding protein
VSALSACSRAMRRSTSRSESGWLSWAIGRTGTSSIDAYDASFRELAARKPDIVIAAGNEPALRAARAAAGALPIVFLAIDFDPVAKGYVASLARPDGNITG